MSPRCLVHQYLLMRAYWLDEERHRGTRPDYIPGRSGLIAMNLPTEL